MKKESFIRFDHFFITRFCIRDPGLFQYRQKRPFYAHPDPWNSKFFERRLALLKMISGAGLRAQTNQNFKWVIVTDSTLPEQVRTEIRSHFSSLKIYFKHFNGIEMFARTDWLAPWITPGISHLITSSHDDDDMLSNHFVETLHNRIQLDHQDYSSPWLNVYGTTGYIDWNIRPSLLYPYGRRVINEFSPITTIKTTGLTLAIKYPELSYTSQRFHHVHTYHYFKFDEAPAIEHVGAFRSDLREQLEVKNRIVDWQSYLGKVTDLYDEVGSVLGVAHQHNNRMNRFLSDDEKNIVDPKVDFQDYSPDWVLIKSHRQLFSAHIKFRINALYKDKLHPKIQKYRREIRRRLKLNN